MDDELKIERIGGLAGLGAPNSRLRSEGTCALGDLPAADRAAVEKLFAQPRGGEAGRTADGFRYRITRATSSGPQTVEVPEADVPERLAAMVRTTVR